MCTRTAKCHPSSSMNLSQGTVAWEAHPFGGLQGQTRRGGLFSVNDIRGSKPRASETVSRPLIGPTSVCAQNPRAWDLQSKGPSLPAPSSHQSARLNRSTPSMALEPACSPEWPLSPLPCPCPTPRSASRVAFLKPHKSYSHPSLKPSDLASRLRPKRCSEFLPWLDCLLPPSHLLLPPSSLRSSHTHSHECKIPAHLPALHMLFLLPGTRLS